MSGKPIATASALTMGFAVLLAGAVLAPATGASAAGASADTPRKANDQRTRRVCRTVTPTSSRLTTRVCRTQGEWEEGMREQQDSFLRHNFDQTRQGPIDGPGGAPR
jgi:hypothetical protein